MKKNGGVRTLWTLAFWMYDEDDDTDVRMMMMIYKDYDEGDAADYTPVPLEKQVRGGRIFIVPQYSTPFLDHSMVNLIVSNVKLIPTTELDGELGD